MAIEICAFIISFIGNTNFSIYYKLVFVMNPTRIINEKTPKITHPI